MSESEKPFKQEIDYHRYWKEQYEKEHKRCQELQGELSIVKATTVTNSPEMREALKEIEYLKKELTIAREEHEFDNMVHRKEMDDLVNKMRKDGIL